MSLGELCRRYGRDLVGETAPEADRFPLLVKFLFPHDKLSVQVHPDDETARRAGLPCGKTECWYVLKAEPGAKIGLGLKPGTRREEFARAIEEVRAEQLLNWIDVRAGEMIYVDAGTVHTIGPGVILLETQQNSDTTYRLYDYGRPRELHVQARTGGAEGKDKGRQSARRGACTGHSAVLVKSPWFMVNKDRLQRTAEVSRSMTERCAETASAEVFVALEGCGVVECDGVEPVTLVAARRSWCRRRARYKVRASGDIEVLHARSAAQCGAGDECEADIAVISPRTRHSLLRPARAKAARAGDRVSFMSKTISIP